MQNCRKPYDYEWESILMNITNARQRMFYQQDLKCIECKKVVKSRFLEHCRKCGQALKYMEDPSELCKEMQVIAMIASYKKFKVLEETAKWNLQMLGIDQV